jgi:L-2-hydroxyglutarate oxidase
LGGAREIISAMKYDFCVIGGGIVGLATALKLLEMQPGAGLLLLEKEFGVGMQQSGHNSGVVHAGIYYKPGSNKAKYCVAGAAALRRFCAEHGVPFEQCGKLIVATNSREEERIAALFERATANGLKLERIGAAELREREPNISGTAALLSPETGIVDFVKVCETLARLVEQAGGTLALGTRVDFIREAGDGVEIGSGDRRWVVGQLVVCAGLQSDRMARLAGLEVDFKVVPFRGEYFQLPAEKNGIIRHLIYPAPDPSLPFLGVHLTRMIDGSVTVGPNAVISFAREGYPKLSFDLRDTLSFASFPGFWKLAWKHRGHVIRELRGSLSRAAYLEECRKYCPSLVLSDLIPYRAGVRAQVVARDGTAVEDFLFLRTSRMLHVCNAPSPAATAALPIGAMIAGRLLAPET